MDTEFNPLEAHLRKIQVLILRLILDSGFPTELRGTLQAVPEGEPQVFRGEEAFLDVLRQYSNAAAEPDGIPTTANPIEPENSG